MPPLRIGRGLDEADDEGAQAGTLPGFGYPEAHLAPIGGIHPDSPTPVACERIIVYGKELGAFGILGGRTRVECKVKFGIKCGKEVVWRFPGITLGAMVDFEMLLLAVVAHIRSRGWVRRPIGIYWCRKIMGGAPNIFAQQLLTGALFSILVSRTWIQWLPINGRQEESLSGGN